MLVLQRGGDILNYGTRLQIGFGKGKTRPWVRCDSLSSFFSEGVSERTTVNKCKLVCNNCINVSRAGAHAHESDLPILHRTHSIK